jgi:transcription elongation GreA/GreB family factor
MTNKFLFFSEDYSGLINTLNKLKDEYKKWGKESTEGSNVGDWHDNFAYEESMRQMELLSRRIKELTDLLTNAEVVQEPPSLEARNKVSVGSKVTVETEEGESRKYFIGSHTLFRDEKHIDGYLIISYTSPVAKALLGLESGEEAEIRIQGKKIRLHVIGIE